MVKWFTKENHKIVATLYPTNIMLNKAGADLVRNEYAALLGIDEEEKEILIRPLNQDEYDSKAHPEGEIFLLSGGKSYVRVSSTEFMNAVSSLFHIDFGKSGRRYSCTYDENGKVFIVKLEQEVRENG